MRASLEADTEARERGSRTALMVRETVAEDVQACQRAGAKLAVGSVRESAGEVGTVL